MAGSQRGPPAETRPFTSPLERNTRMAAKKKTTKKAKQKRSQAKTGGQRKKTQKAAQKTKAPKASKTAGKLSALEAAVRVLAEAGQPLTCREMIDAMAAKKYWTSPAGKTPANTLYAAILRETQTKADQARFRKVDRGRFDLTTSAR